MYRPNTHHYNIIASQDLISDTTSDSRAPDSLVSKPLSLFSVPTHPKTKRRTRTSPIWEHTSFNNRNDIVLNKDNKVIWRCRYCPQEYIERGGTGVVFQHLASLHSINLKTSHEAQKGLVQDTIATAFARAAQSGEHKRRRLDSAILTKALDPDVLERLYVQWLTWCGVSFSMVEKIEFRA